MTNTHTTSLFLTSSCCHLLPVTPSQCLSLHLQRFRHNFVQPCLSSGSYPLSYFHPPHEGTNPILNTCFFSSSTCIQFVLLINNQFFCSVIVFGLTTEAQAVVLSPGLLQQKSKVFTWPPPHFFSHSTNIPPSLSPSASFSVSGGLSDLFPQEKLVSIRSTYSGEDWAFSFYSVGRKDQEKKKITKLKIPPVLLFQNQPSKRNASFLPLTPGASIYCSISSLTPQEGVFCSVYWQNLVFLT